MSRADCTHLGGDGICKGKYKGFGCIGERCRDATKGPGTIKCKHGRDDGYCMKHKKFQCEGEDCGDYDV